MPPKKRPQPFAWDEEKKKVVVECLTRIRQTCTLQKDVIVELRKQFIAVYPECKLTAKTLYPYALAAEANKQLPGETESRVPRWKTEEDAFLIECVARAHKENQRSLEFGLQAGKVGGQGQFGKFVLQFFQERYPDERTSNALFKRISHLRKEKQLCESKSTDNTTANSLVSKCVDATANLRSSDQGESVDQSTVVCVHLPDERNNMDTATANSLMSECVDATANLRSSDQGESVDQSTVVCVHLPDERNNMDTATANSLVSECVDATANLRSSEQGVSVENVSITVVDSGPRAVESDNIDSRNHNQLINVFKTAMKYWEFGFKFSSRSMFVGACAKCSMILIDEHCRNPVKTMVGQPTVFTFYDQKYLSLKVIDSKTSKCYYCTLCAKHNLLDKFNLAPKTVKYLPLPKAIADLSDDDKRQVCLIALKSTTAKASSDALRIFKHNKGDFIPQLKDDMCYFNMYSMIVNKDPVNTVGSNNTVVVVTALKWLRKNNHLYSKFLANYETLLRFVKRQPGQPLTVPVLSDVDFDPVSSDQTKTSVLDGEQSGLIIPAYNVPSRGVNVGNTVTATQHVRSKSAAKSAHMKLLNVFIKDMYLEAKVFPWLFPYGTGGWCSTESCGFTRGAYLRWRLCMCDSRFRDEIDYMFYMLDIIIKERLQYYSSTKVNVAKLAEPLTAQKLVDAAKSTNPYDQYGTEVPASIPNSRNYWASKTLDLIAMSEYMGRVPDLFVTLTENDTWPELQAVIRDGLAGIHQAPDSKEFENIHKRGAPAMKFPVQTVIAFYRRLREFRSRFLQDPKGPFGHVQDYWIRIEYQKRGSLHAHLVIWSEKGTLPEGIVSAEMPRFDHPMNWKWREIVGNFQKHDCYSQRCFTGKRGTVLSSCKYGFPYTTCDTVAPEKRGVRYRYIRRSPEDLRIIPYSLPLILFWDGHVNVQLVTNGGWELYLAKYVAKSEYPIRMRIKHKRQSDCETYLKSRVVSLLEAATLLLQYPHVFSSREVVYLPVSVSPAYRFLKRMSDMPTHLVDHNELYYDTKLEKYLDRPDVLSDLTYPQFFAQYRYHGRAAPENEELDDGCDIDVADNVNADNVNTSKAQTLRDKKGRQIRKRVHHEAIVRFKSYSPYGDSLEMYCLTKLLQNIPVNRESLAALKDDTGSYLEECMRRNLIEEHDEAKQFLEGAAKRGISLSRLREMATRLIDGNWLQDQDIDQLLETVAPYQMQAERVRAEPVDDDDDNVIVDDRDGLDLNIRTYLPVAEYVAGFTDSQRVAFEFVTDTWRKGKQCLAFVTGGGGVGKSYLLDSLVAFCNENNKTVQKLATTGCAAHLIGGLTIHSFLRMTPDLECHIERGTTDALLIDRLNVLLIDEVSMLEERIMHKLEDCMNIFSRNFTADNNSLSSRFAGKSVIMFGDPAQLPPIGNHIWQPKLLTGFHIVVLKEIVRQKDDRQFVDLLNRVRLGQPTDADLDLLKTRVVSNVQLRQIEIGDRGLTLFPTRRQKNEMNANELTKLSVTPRHYPAEDVDENGNPLPHNIKQYIADLEEKNLLLAAVLTLKIGARVMLVRNRDVEHGWVNGTLATVVNMSDDYVVIAAINNPKRRLITFRIRSEIRTKNANKQYYRRQFPLELAYGVTIHKAQGQTLDVVAVSAVALSFSGQFYTAISRVRELEGLYLIDFEPESIFLAPDIRKLIDWMNEVDVTRRPQTSGTIKKRMPEVSQSMARLGWTVTKPLITTNVVSTVPNTTTTTTNNNKRILPAQTVVTLPNHHGKRVRREPQIDSVLDSIYRLNTACPLERYLESFDAVISEQCVENFSVMWTERINREKGSVFDETLLEHSVDQQRSNQTYAVFSEQYGRVIQTAGDNSCLFHALSLCLFGHQRYDREFRLLCCMAFREHSMYYDSQHAKIHLQYDSVQHLIQQTSNIHGGQESWGGSAHLKAMADIACREIYVYTGFTKDVNGVVHPRCVVNRNLSIDELQRKCNTGELYGLYFTRYMPRTIPVTTFRPLTVLLSDAGVAAHYSAILPIAEDVPLVRPCAVVPSVLNDYFDDAHVLIDRIDINENENNMIISD